MHFGYAHACCSLWLLFTSNCVMLCAFAGLKLQTWGTWQPLLMTLMIFTMLLAIVVLLLQGRGLCFYSVILFCWLFGSF